MAQYQPTGNGCNQHQSSSFLSTEDQRLAKTDALVPLLHGDSKMSAHSRFRRLLAPLFFVFVGLVAGGYLFDQSQPRSFLALNHCTQCMSAADLAGLLASVGIQKVPNALPFVVYETNKTIAIRNPFVRWRTDYVIIPKIDIKNIGQMSARNESYILDAYKVAAHIIKEKHLSNYRLLTNGPGLQKVTYLHFHLFVRKPNSGKAAP